MSEFFDEIEQGVNPDDLEKRMESNGLIPPGLYRATMIGVKPHTSKQKGTQSDEFTFRVSHGPFAGKTIVEQLWKTDGMKDKRTLFASRLGLIRRTADGKKFEPVPGKKDWLDCLDVACIIEVHHEKYKRDDGTEGVVAKLTFSGLKNPNDPKILAAFEKQEKGGSGTSATVTTNPTSDQPAQPSASAPQKRKPDISDL